MKGQMLPLICLHNSPWSPGWLPPTQGLPACHPVMRVFYSRWSERNKESSQSPHSPEQKALHVGALNRHLWPTTYTDSPQSCNHFHAGSPRPLYWCQAQGARHVIGTYLHHRQKRDPSSADTWLFELTLSPMPCKHPQELHSEHSQPNASISALWESSEMLQAQGIAKSAFTAAGNMWPMPSPAAQF